MGERQNDERAGGCALVAVEEHRRSHPAKTGECGGRYERMRRRHPSLSLCQGRLSAACCSPFDHRPASWKKEEGCFSKNCPLMYYYCTHCAQENTELAHKCHNGKNHHAYVFIRTQNCQHTHTHTRTHARAQSCVFVGDRCLSGGLTYGSARLAS